MGDVPELSKREETLGKAQNQVERLDLLPGLGALGDPQS